MSPAQPLARPQPDRARLPGLVPALGVFWAWAAAGKFAELLGFAPLSPWLAEWPGAALGTIVAFEAALAVGLMGARRGGEQVACLCAGLGALAAFSIVLAADPPPPGGCGCLGTIGPEWLVRMDPLARNALLAGLHALALAGIRPVVPASRAGLSPAS